VTYQTYLVVHPIDKNQAEKRCLLGCNKNYVTLALNYMLENSKRIILVSENYRRDRNKNVIKGMYKKHLLTNMFSC